MTDNAAALAKLAKQINALASIIDLDSRAQLAELFAALIAAFEY